HGLADPAYPVIGYPIVVVDEAHDFVARLGKASGARATEANSRLVHNAQRCGRIGRPTAPRDLSGIVRRRIVDDQYFPRDGARVLLRGQVSERLRQPRGAIVSADYHRDAEPLLVQSGLAVVYGLLAALCSLSNHRDLGRPFPDMSLRHALFIPLRARNFGF